MKHTHAQSGAASRGFSLIELLVVIAIVALLIAILLPVLGSVRDKARATVCMTRAQQMSVAVNAFSADNASRLPANRTSLGDGRHVTWRHTFQRDGYISQAEAWVCPAHPGEPLSELGVTDRGSVCAGDVESSFALNGHVLWSPEKAKRDAERGDNAIQRPSHTILVAETTAPYPDLRATDALIAADTGPDGEGGVYGYWHSGDGTYAFQDGHAEFINLMDTGSPDCRWHNGRDWRVDQYDEQTSDELRTHDHPDWVYLASPVYLNGQ